MKKIVFSLSALMLLTLVFATTVSADNHNKYTIQSGDTLWGISKAHDVTVKQLMSWNDLSSDLIYPGQTLSVSEESEDKENSQTDTFSYTVKPGNTLYGISHKFNVTVDELMTWNNLSTTLIFPGDQFTIKKQETMASAVQKAPSSKTMSTNTSESGDHVVREFTAHATAYTAYCTGCSGVTATGIDLRANPNQKVIAVDPNIIPLGTKVYVEGYGKAIAGDVGGAIKGHAIDLFIPNRQDALEFGRQDIKVQILKE